MHNLLSGRHSIDSFHIHIRDLRSFVIRFRIVRPIRDSIRIDGPIRIESSALSVVIRKETIGGG